MAIIRVLQQKGSVSDSSFVQESFNPETKTWHFCKQVYNHFKDAKVRHHNQSIYLIGTGIDSLQEIKLLQEKYIIGKELEWNNQDVIYPYIEWVDYFEAYY